MRKQPWFEPELSGERVLASWEPASDIEASLIVREALRYCPEFPFKVDSQPTFQKTLLCYEDYRLVRLAPATVDGFETTPEVYGFYAPGDFRPIGRHGAVFDWMNKFVPLRLSAQSVLDYVLTRLRFELTGIFRTPLPEEDEREQPEVKLAEIVNDVSQLRFSTQLTDEYRASLAKLIQSPQVTSSETDQNYQVICTAVVYSDTKASLTNVNASVSSDGTLWLTFEPIELTSTLIRQAGCVMVDLRRARTAIPIQQWHVLAQPDTDAEELPPALALKLGAKPWVWHQAVEETYGGEWNVKPILRVADLLFYKTYCLLEVQLPDSDSYRRSYALVRFHNGGYDTRPLNGTSAIIHTVNAEDLQLKGEATEEYLRFFCWGTHSDEGPFLIPRTMREVPFEDPPNAEQVKAFQEFDSHSKLQWSITELTQAGDDSSRENEKREFRAPLFYGPGFFEARFKVDLNGGVEMLEDIPRTEGLKIASERYGEKPLFVLKESQHTEAAHSNLEVFVPKQPWLEPALPGEEILVSWERASDVEATLIVREALRYCPEFPFKPNVTQVFQKLLRCYEDYRLVRLVPETTKKSSVPPEVYGFYTPGDFRPAGRQGSVFEWLNKFVPLQLTAQTILDYTLTRLRFELTGIFEIPSPEAAHSEQPEVKLAEIVNHVSELQFKYRPGDESYASIAAAIQKPSVTSPGDGQYQVVCTALVHRDAKAKLVNIQASVGSDGALSFEQKAVELSSPLISQAEAVVANLLRARTAVPIEQWHQLGEKGAHAVDLPHPLALKLGTAAWIWHRTVRERYGHGWNSELILRAADLIFYKTFFLLEIQLRDSTSYRRSYALARFHHDKLDIRPLDGKSPIIHNINSEHDKPRLKGEAAEEYLRFFCWAIHGEEGPFLIPRRMREVPFESPPTAEQLKALQGFDQDSTFSWSITELKRNGDASQENVKKEFRAPVFYGGGFFEAKFRIDPTGAIELFEDNPLAEGLEIAKERYGDADLFLLTDASEKPPELADLPTPRHYLEEDTQSEESGESPNTQSVREAEQVINAEEFNSAIRSSGAVSNKAIKDQVTFDERFFK